MNGSEDLALLSDGLVILSSVSVFFRLFARVNLSVQHALKQHFCQKLVNLVNNVSCRLILCFLREGTFFLGGGGGEGWGLRGEGHQ